MTGHWHIIGVAAQQSNRVYGNRLFPIIFSPTERHVGEIRSLWCREPLIATRTDSVTLRAGSGIRKSRPPLPSTTFTLRIDTAAKKRLEKLAENTGRSRSFLAAKAITEYLSANEWKVAGSKTAVAFPDRGNGIPHQKVKEWVGSWGSDSKRPAQAFHTVTPIWSPEAIDDLASLRAYIAQ
jgi:RHH-type transcriptional regulator, rel operon repressor / antitoxin RelB